MSVKWSWCSNLNRSDIFYIERFICCMTHEGKLSIKWPCSSNFRRFARDFVRSKYANSVSQFLSYSIRIICCIYKDFVRQLKAFLSSLCHLCACEISPKWGHLITWRTLEWGIWTAFWPVWGVIWTIIFKKVKCPGISRGVCWSFDLTETSCFNQGRYFAFWEFRQEMRRISPDRRK